MPTYDFICPEGHVEEKICGYDVDTVICPMCGCKSIRQSVYLFTPVTETGVKIGRLSMTPRDEKRYDVTLFQEACAEREYAHTKSEEIAQRKLPSENLWGKAKKKANQILTGKEPPTKAQTRFKK